MSPAHLATWVGEIGEAFEEAAAANGVVERRVRLGGLVLGLRAAGPRLLEQLGPALDHLAGDFDEDPALTISIWDSAGAGVAPPPLPETDPDEPRGAVFYSADDLRQVAYQPGLSQLSAYDSAAGAAWFWCRSSATLPFWEPAAPFRQILHWWLARRGLMLLHGAAVGLSTGGVLLAGRGGSGKSTCALASLTSDLLYAGDDYVAVAEDPEPYVSSLYCSGKLQPGHAKLLPHLPPPSFDGDGSPEEKAVFYVRERFPDRMCQGFPLRAVLVPTVRGSEPRITPVPAGAALRALAPSTLLQLYPARPEALAGMARLLRRVPAYAL
ncbi:MAG TPA: hypothetical protein VNH40_14950, partial [Gaiellaceae bacterium]|nr:hypothetical protein [Gaiellaceae bacterium]